MGIYHIFCMSATKEEGKNNRNKNQFFYNSSCTVKTCITADVIRHILNTLLSMLFVSGMPPWPSLFLHHRGFQE